MQRPHDPDPGQPGVATMLGDQHQRVDRHTSCRRVVLVLRELGDVGLLGYWALREHSAGVWASRKA
jgi:hypothetical protein